MEDQSDLANTGDSKAKMEKLLAVLPRKGQGFLDTFISCLKASSDGTAHDELAGRLEEARLKAHAEWTQASMEDDHCSSTVHTAAADREVLRKYYPELMRTLKYRDVYPYVVQRGLVTHSQMMELASSVESEKTEKLLAMLIGSSSGVLSKFIWCLKQSGNGTAHKLIGQKLEKARAEMKVQPGTQVLLYQSIGLGPEVSNLEVGGGEPQHHWRLPKTTGFWAGHYKMLLCCYVSLVLAVVLLIALIVVLAFVPSPGKLVKPSNQLFTNDTVELEFSRDVLWIHKMTMSVPGPCEGKVLVIDGTSCVEFRQSHAYTRVDVNSSTVDNIYLLKGSNVVFTTTAGATSEVWIFSNSETANKYSNDHDGFNCDQHPSSCFKSSKYVQGHYPFPVQESSYYYLRFSDNLSAAAHIKWTYNISYYDYTTLRRKYTPRLTLTSEPRALHLGPYFHYRTSCILVHMLQPSSRYRSKCGKLKVEGLMRRQDVLVYPASLLLVAIVFLTIVIVIHCKCYCNWRYSAL